MFFLQLLNRLRNCSQVEKKSKYRNKAEEEENQTRYMLHF